MILQEILNGKKHMVEVSLTGEETSQRPRTEVISLAAIQSQQIMMLPAIMVIMISGFSGLIQQGILYGKNATAGRNSKMLTGRSKQAMEIMLLLVSQNRMTGR